MESLGNSIIILCGLWISSILSILPLDRIKIRGIKIASSFSLFLGIMAIDDDSMIWVTPYYIALIYMLVFFGYFKIKIMPIYNKESLSILSALVSFVIFIFLIPRIGIFLSMILLFFNFIVFIILSFRKEKEKLFKKISYFWQLILTTFLLVFSFFYVLTPIDFGPLSSFIFGLSIYYLIVPIIPFVLIFFALPVSWLFYKMNLSLWDQKVYKTMELNYVSVNTSVINIFLIFSFTFFLLFLNHELELFSEIIIVNIFVFIAVNLRKKKSIILKDFLEEGL